MEEAARREWAGLWQGEFHLPWDWRRGDRRILSGGTPADSGGALGQCRIKGNISGNGRIYHLPGQQHYARTQIDESRGERWFCFEDEARAAGWRPAAR